MRNIRLDLEYDGTDFSGWAKQPGIHTIENTLEEALQRILQEEPRLIVAGRTDAGVHARNQVVNFHTSNLVETGQLRRSLNKMLPEAVVVTAADEVPAGFDARRGATSRTYTYTVLNRPYPSAFDARFSYFYPGRLDVQLLHDAASLVLGRHDFTAFTPTVTEHSYFEREISQSQWRMDGDFMIYWISSSSFMRNMVRVIVGTMLEVGRGYRPLKELESLLKGAVRPEAGVTAPPQGLCFEGPAYGKD